jgi:meso-butanediol dehydrogenase/(S,S)-butanediol dehydrogenase/diacetyl reductase
VALAAPPHSSWHAWARISSWPSLTGRTLMWTSVAREQGALLNQSPEEFTRRRVHQIPLGRMEQPGDVANVIGFLVSPRSDYMTGQALSVDGGLVMHG